MEHLGYLANKSGSLAQRAMSLSLSILPLLNRQFFVLNLLYHLAKIVYLIQSVDGEDSRARPGGGTFLQFMILISCNSAILPESRWPGEGPDRLRGCS